jgi:hypothetical protein
MFDFTWSLNKEQGESCLSRIAPGFVAEDILCQLTMSPYDVKHRKRFSFFIFVFIAILRFALFRFERHGPKHNYPKCSEFVPRSSQNIIGFCADFQHARKAPQPSQLHSDAEPGKKPRIDPQLFFYFRLGGIMEHHLLSVDLPRGNAVLGLHAVHAEPQPDLRAGHQKPPGEVVARGKVDTSVPGRNVHRRGPFSSLRREPKEPGPQHHPVRPKNENTPIELGAQRRAANELSSVRRSAQETAARAKADTDIDEPTGRRLLWRPFGLEGGDRLSPNGGPGK